MIFSRGFLTKGKTSLSSLVGMGSSIQVDYYLKLMLSLVHEGQLDGSFPNISGIITSSVILDDELESVKSDKYLFFLIKEVHKIMTGEDSRNAWFNTMMTLS